MARSQTPKLRMPWRPPSLTWPITVGIVMIVLVVLLGVAFVLLGLNGWNASRWSSLYLVLLVAGLALLVLVLLGTVFYLTISIKAINLNQRQSNFIDSVTHELKSPIASLKLYLQTLNRHEVSERQRAEFYRSMLEDVERLDRLINQLLVAARITQDTDPQEIEDVPLHTLLKSSVESVRLLYNLPSEAVELDLTPVIVHGRLIDVELIFRNLIDNAAKYAGKPPLIGVQCFALSSGKVVVRVTDNGRGVPPAWRRRIFGRFVRLGSELERDKPGMGLGLFLASEHIKKMRGKITIRGHEDKPGSVFEVILPGEAATALDGPEDDSTARRLNEPKSSGSVIRRLTAAEQQSLNAAASPDATSNEPPK